MQTSFKKQNVDAMPSSRSPAAECGVPNVDAVPSPRSTAEQSPVAAVADRSPSNHQLATANSEIPPIGGISGDFAEGDFRLPRINIVQAVGPLSEDFEPGTIVLNKDIVLLAASKDPKVWGDPLSVTVLNAKKQFSENLPYDSDETPQTVETLEEVTARGGWLEWRDDAPPPWRPILTALLLIEAPNEFLADEFSIQGPDGKGYELALWTMKGTSYSRAGKAINTAARFALRNKDTGLPELHKGKWTLQVRREKLGTNLVFVPRLRQHGKHTDEFIEFITTLL